MFVIITASVFIVDQLSKFLVSTNMSWNQTVELFPGVFDLTYIRNTGAAFGIFEGRIFLLSAVTAVLLIGLCVYAVSQRNKIPRLESVSLALIVGGGLGNLVTRLLYNYVIDFFNFYFWPVFNVADIAICVGCGFLILSVLVIEPKKQKQRNNG